MKQKGIILIFLLFVFVTGLLGDYLHTIDRKVYEGKMVAFKFNTIYFNVYKFGKIHRTKRFPLSLVWKIEFSEPKEEVKGSSFEIEQNYNRLRRGKRVKKIVISGDQRWVDSGINVKIGQEIMFSASGSININKDTTVFQSGEEFVNWNQSKPLPNHSTGAIIGRIGKKGELFYIGDDKAPFQVVEEGRLYIGINDSSFKDNSGQFNLTIYY